MRRAAIERPRTLRTWRRHIARTHGGDTSLCICDRQPSRFRKGQRVGGCGNARCFVCHYEKILDLPTIQEIKAMDRERDGLQEVFHDVTH